MKTDKQNENVQAYKEVLSPERRRSLALTAVTAVALEEDEEEMLRNQLGKVLGKRPRVTFETSSRLIAGMILRTRDRALDGSVGRQLRRLRRILLEHDLQLETRPEITAEGLLAEMRKIIEEYQPQMLIDDVGTVEEFGDGVARISGLHEARVGELVKFQNGSFGMVLNLEDNYVGAIVLVKAWIFTPAMPCVCWDILLMFPWVTRCWAGWSMPWVNPSTGWGPSMPPGGARWSHRRPV